MSALAKGAFRRSLLPAAIAAALLGGTGLAQQTIPALPGAAAPAVPSVSRAEGEALFKQRCATCHDPAIDRAPSREQMGQMWADDIAKALTSGSMQPMAAGLSEGQIAAIAEYVSGSRPNANRPPEQVDPPRCAAGARFTPDGRNWNGWGGDHRNHRFQTNGGLSAADIPRLKVKWSFTYIGARYSQPAVVGGRLFMASASGAVYAFDARTGCYHWRFDAPAGVRTTILVGPDPGAPSGYAVYFGDYGRNYYAVDAGDGRQLWKTNVESHPRGVLTGSPVLHDGQLIVPVSSWEEVVSSAAQYQCCTARGSIVALDARTGKINWKTYTIEETPRPTRRNSAGTQLYGPAGGAIWSTPTVDPKRGLVYATTGNSYTEIPEKGSNAVIAMDLKTGRVRWRNQVQPADNYLMGCAREPRPLNCPLGEAGPDFDFGASAVLIPLPDGKEVLLAGQKSGVVYGLNPDDGRIVWRTRLGAGSALGGIEFGMATDGKVAYVANADAVGSSPDHKPGLYAVDPATGRVLWGTPSPKVPCGWTVGSRCVNANSAAPIVIPGAVIAGTIDGHLRAYDPAAGAITWTFNTAGQTYDTINGTKGQGGGAIDAGGAIVAEGMVFLMSGYVANMGGVPNNVLLALSPDGQ